MIALQRQKQGGVPVLVHTMALVMWLLLGCTPHASTDPDSYPSVAEVSTVQIPVPAHATTILHEEQRSSVIDEVTSTTTYTTDESVAAMTTYYQNMFRTLRWETHGVGAGLLDVGAGDLIFGQAGRDGEEPGDPIVLRNVVVSIQPCGTETCVTMKDQLRRTTVPEPFN
jgi:hypothetical protein